MTTVATVQWDPYDSGLAADPYPTYRRLREEAPLYYNEEHDFYALSRYSDCEQGLPDWDNYRSGRGMVLEIIKSGFEIPPGTLIMEDPPVHTIHRRLLVKVFTPRRIGALEPKVREFCARALDPYRGRDQFDLMEALGGELPMRVIGMLLGIPEADQASVRDHVGKSISIDDGSGMDVNNAALLSGDIYGDYIDWRRDHPGDDLMTELLHTEFEDENGVRRALTRDEVLGYVTILSGAGNETTGRLVGWIGSALAAHPDQRQELVDDPALIPNAVEEVLRYEPPSMVIARTVHRDAEWHGTTVPAGAALLFVVGSANRDDRRYPHADAFDIHREVGQHLTLGLGAHYCLGAALARLQGRIATQELLTRFPRWDVDWQNAKMAQTSTVRGWETLPLLIR
ncbi:cytochrome P450 [Frankia sp. AgB1.9]|uniref:cytochrome P450 n=1 Tax=unclassified Frankia TaxID=2632575 RepID=UPI001932AC62|nr:MULTISPECIES: cytochrome P450 [unclassified Frankia]MBL7488850.1 cytochrome P450 [Frankia sp. AgW1.1]MBL7546494.1 cytochrome P450 [Frankia sp. AgB1.9]MBL7620247.1 cytochrome P450 [Frankia sp. AgB1.8]